MAEALRRESDDPQFIPDNIHDAVKLIHADLQNIKSVQTQQAETLDRVHEILTVFNDAKGFIHTVQLFAKVAMWVSLFLGGVAAVLLAWKNR